LGGAETRQRRKKSPDTQMERGVRTELTEGELLLRGDSEKAHQSFRN